MSISRVTANPSSTAAGHHLEPDLVYGFDPLCGWCFGFIPALEALVRQRPDMTVQLALGGLVTGERIRPYAELAGYIKQSSERLVQVTGQHLGAAFFERILTRTDVLASSIAPSAAILQVRQARPEKTLAFAHAVQRAHFEQGKDLNEPAIYADLLTQMALDIAIELPPGQQCPDFLTAEFRATRAMGISTFPTVLVRSDGGLKPLPTTYNPGDFITQVSSHLGDEAASYS